MNILEHSYISHILKAKTEIKVGEGDHHPVVGYLQVCIVETVSLTTSYLSISHIKFQNQGSEIKIKTNTVIIIVRKILDVFRTGIHTRKFEAG